MKRIKQFLTKIYYQIYLYFYHCDGNCDKCYENNSQIYLVCICGKIRRKNINVATYIKSQQFCIASKEWTTRYTSFEKMLKKIRNPFWLMFALYYYHIKPTLITKASFAMIDKFIPYASDRNKDLFLRANYIINKHGIESEELLKFRDNIKEQFDMHIGGEDDTDRFNMNIASAIKYGCTSSSILPNIIIIAGENYCSKWTKDSVYKMICDCIRQNCGEELLRIVYADFESWRLRKLLSNQ